MNRISVERQGQIVIALVEGNSIRSTVRMNGTPSLRLHWTLSKPWFISSTKHYHVDW